MTIGGEFPTFRVYSVDETAHGVAADLLLHGVEYALFRSLTRSAVRWEVFRVDDDLLHVLWRRRGTLRGPTVASALKRRRSAAERSQTNLDLKDMRGLAAAPEFMNVAYVAAPRLVLAGYGGLPRAYVDHAGAVVAVGVGDKLPRARATVYPNVDCADGPEVEPGQTVEFSLSIRKEPTPSGTDSIDVRFPAGAKTIDLVAEVSSDSFVQPDGVEWSTTFVLDRQLESSPNVWNFQARAHGPRERYSLRIRFLTEGYVVGVVEAMLVRRGSKLPAKIEKRAMFLPEESGAARTVNVTFDASGKYSFSCFRGGKRVGAPESKMFVGDPFFTSLENSQSMRTLEEISLGLSTELPDDVRAFLAVNADQGVPTLFASTDRVAPFELARARLDDDRSFLGVERPVSRWIDCPMSDIERLDVGAVACIRPSYTSSPLPAAEQEGDFLQQTFGAHRVATEADVDGLVARHDVGLVHFAGHADGVPAELVLEKGARIKPTRFDPAKPLMATHPFFFINGCRAGLGTKDAPSMLGNFVRSLLIYGASGAAAPVIRVDSQAALQATRTFYTTVARSSVVDAIRRVHEIALDPATPDGLRASYLSYVVFANPRLRMSLPSRGAAVP